MTSALYWVSQNPAVKQQLFAEIDRFGRDRQVTAADMDQFPYLEVSLICFEHYNPGIPSTPRLAASV